MGEGGHLLPVRLHQEEGGQRWLRQGLLLLRPLSHSPHLTLLCVYVCLWPGSPDCLVFSSPRRCARGTIRLPGRTLYNQRQPAVRCEKGFSLLAQPQGQAGGSAALFTLTSAVVQCIRVWSV